MIFLSELDLQQVRWILLTGIETDAIAVVFAKIQEDVRYTSAV